MILTTWNEDDVSGGVIGRYMLSGALYYGGKRQGGIMYAETEAALREMAEARLMDRKTEIGLAFGEIYTDSGGWSLRIFD